MSKSPYLISATPQTDPVFQSIEKFSKCLSIINIKNKMRNLNCTFSFKFETQEKFSKLMQNLSSNKATQQYDIPIKILKGNRFPHTFYATNSTILCFLKTSLTV